MHSMGNSFYTLENGRQAGPYTAEQLAESGLQADTLVWADGMSAWSQAGRVPALAGTIYTSSSPPQYEEAVAVAYESPVTTSQPFRSVPGYPGIVSGAFVLRVIGWVFVVLGILVAGFPVAMMLTAEIDRGPRTDGPLGWLVLAPFLFAGAMSVGYGLLFMFVGSVGIAVRDIARNSFK